MESAGGNIQKTYIVFPFIETWLITGIKLFISIRLTRAIYVIISVSGNKRKLNRETEHSCKPMSGN